MSSEKKKEKGEGEGGYMSLLLHFYVAKYIIWSTYIAYIDGQEVSHLSRQTPWPTPRTFSNHLEKR